MAARIFAINSEFTLNKEATLESHGAYWTVSSTSSRLKSPGIISTEGVNLLRGKTYAVIVTCRKSAESTPYIYVSTTSNRTYITNTTWGRTTAVFTLDSNESVKVGVLMEDAQDGDSFDVSEIILREHIPNFGQVRFDMSESNSLTLQKSELTVGRIKFRWNKALERLEMASANDQEFNVTIINHLNAFDHNSLSAGTVMRPGFIELDSEYKLFFEDLGTTVLTVPVSYYTEYSFTVITDNVTESYKIDVITDGLNGMNIRIQGA